MGVLESPDFPTFYPGQLSCSWIIKSPNLYNQVNFIFIWFNTNEGKKQRQPRKTRCVDDFLEIKQEFDGKMERVNTYCGKKKSFRTQAHSQLVEVRCKTKKFAKRPGFRLIWYISRGKYILIFLENTGYTLGYPFIS